ncbi:MAG TPA: nitronate monooxygenase family protein [Candidatus Krumholzibacteria bacterium]|nr:nitronate monooxygenase family protein [Candidatus Krumholzibacteria bacterium]HPD70978.1 nitronate monooxygenase family protein [Candidatus Krumholzibacteria bacterium]HRY39322.1 nitronate monooxygenase family protein [Candidatus Krumholzibacteria bacterium]
MSNHEPVILTPRLARLFARGREFLGVEVPIMCGAMTWISESGLVSLMSNLGAFGSLAAGNMPPDLFAAEVRKTQELTSKPFAANLITIAPNYLTHLDILCEARLTHIVFAGSIPRRTEVEKAKASGAKVLCFASNPSIARRMLDYGADGLILEGSEAGGHIGHVSTVVLLQDVLFEFGDEVPIFIAGGIGHGGMIGHLGLMGAAGAQLGTRFVVAEECSAHPRFKEVFIKARAREAISTPQYSSKLPVVAVRALNNPAMEEFGQLQLALLKRLEAGEITRQEAQYQVEHFWVGSLREGAVEGKVETGSLMAGQSVGLVHRIQPLREILAELVRDADLAVSRAEGRLVGGEYAERA